MVAHTKVTYYRFSKKITLQERTYWTNLICKLTDIKDDNLNLIKLNTTDYSQV